MELEEIYVSLNGISPVSRAVLVDAVQQAGEYSVDFDGAPLAPGLYFYCLETEAGAVFGKMLLL